MADWHLGARIDHDTNGIPTADALGDDALGVLDDEDGAFYFAASSSQFEGDDVELWKSDGTAAGTFRVKDINPGAGSSSPAELVVMGEALYFTATDGNSGIELWKTDGTEAGTMLIKDIRVPGSSSPQSLTAVDRYVFFSADDGINGEELWVSDGTEPGTVLVQDIYPGSVGSFPENLAAAGDSLFFTATEPSAGRELWQAATPVAQKVDLHLSLDAMPRELLVGDSIQLEVAAVNPGPNVAHGVVLQLNSTLAFSDQVLRIEQGPAWDYNLQGGIMTIELGTLVPLQTAFVEIQLQPLVEGVLDVQASVSARQTELNPGDNTAVSTILIQPRMDYGDAPDSFGTLLGSDGARHAVEDGWHLGNFIDAELDGQPVNGDDLNNQDDEDGVRWPTELVPGMTNNILVWASTNGYLNGWVDGDADGAWDARDHLLVDVPVGTGVNSILFRVPSGFGFTQTWARIRFHSLGGLSPLGWASDGEVEDYRVSVGHSDTNWLAERLVPKDNPDNHAMGAVGVNMVVTRSDQIYLFYRESGFGKRLLYTTSTDRGDSWSTPSPFEPLTPMPGNSTMPTVAIDTNDSIHAAWQSQGPPDQLHYARLNTAAGTWSHQQIVQPSPRHGSVQFPQVTADRMGRVHLVWFEGNDRETNDVAEVMYALMPEGTNRFLAPTMLSSDDNRISAYPMPDLSGVSDDVIAVAWRDNIDGMGADPGTDWDIQMRVSEDGGLNWNPEILTASGDTNRQWNPLLVVDRHGIFHLAYHQYQGGSSNTSIHIGHSEDRGVSWQNQAGAPGFLQASPSSENHELTSAAYDFANHITWFFWKQAAATYLSDPYTGGIRGTYILKGGHHIETDLEKVTNLEANATGAKSFAVGPDGTVRAQFAFGRGDAVTETTLHYRERRRIPLALPPILAPTMIENSSLRIQWDSEFGVTYTVLYTPDLAEWMPAGPSMEGDGTVMEFTSTLDDGTRFFRIEARR